MNRTSIDISDQKETTGTLLRVECGVLRFTEYEVRTAPKFTRELPGGKKITEENVDIVVGVPPILRNPNPPTISGMPLDATHVVTLNKSLLFEVLSLGRNIDVVKGFCDSMEAIPIGGILDLCHKYGLIAGGNLYPHTQQHLVGLTLWRVRYRIFNLCWRFTTYMALIYDDVDRLRALVPDVRFREDMWERVLGNDEVRATTREWLCDLSNPAYIKSSPAYDEDLGRFILKTWASDVLEACDVFLSLLLLNGEAETRKNVKVCKNAECRAYFLGHGNAKYCPNCKRQTVWIRKKRAEEKRKKGSGRSGKKETR